MKSTTTRLLGAIIVGSLALGAWGVWYLGIPLVSAQKKAQDTHRHEEHGHKEKPKARGAREQSTPTGQEQEGHKHDEHEEEKIVRLINSDTVNVKGNKTRQEGCL